MDNEKYMVSTGHYCLPVDCCGEIVVRDYTLDEAVNRSIDILNEHLSANFTYKIINSTEEPYEGSTKYYLRIALMGNLYVRAESLKDAWKLAEDVLGTYLNDIKWSLSHEDK